jgi:hypothetical protein
MAPPFWEFPPHPIPLRRLRVVSAAVLRLPRPRWTAFARNGNFRQLIWGDHLLEFCGDCDNALVWYGSPHSRSV